MKLTRWGLAVACVLIGAAAISLNAQGARIGINVVTNTAVTDAIVADLGRYGAVTGVIPEINGVTLRGTRSAIAAIAARPCGRCQRRRRAEGHAD